MKKRVFIVGAILLCVLGYKLSLPHYSDEKMIAHFQANEEAFNRLARMFVEDANVHMIYDLNELKNIMPEDRARSEGALLLTGARYSEYVKLLEKLNRGRPISRDYHGGRIILSYTVGRDGPNIDGVEHYTEKCFVYSPQPIDWSLRDSLDAGEEGYRRINDHWYLFYREDSTRGE